MSAPLPFIGSRISLISKSEIRYEGLLFTIDTKESTVALTRVKMFGTEDRKVEKAVPASNEIYEFIIFRGSDIKDLTVCEAPQRTTPNDPAIISAQPSLAPPMGMGMGMGMGMAPSVGGFPNPYAPFAAGYGPFSPYQPMQQQPQQQQQQQQQQLKTPAGLAQTAPAVPVPAPAAPAPVQQQQQTEETTTFQHQPTEPTEKPHLDIQRNQQQQQQQQHHQGGGYNRRYNQQQGGGGGRRQQQQNMMNNNRPGNEAFAGPAMRKEQLDEFDFAASNSQFDKEKLKEEKQAEEDAKQSEQKDSKGYNKGKSFFDNLTCESVAKREAAAAAAAQGRPFFNDFHSNMFGPNAGQQQRRGGNGGGRRGGGGYRRGGGGEGGYYSQFQQHFPPRIQRPPQHQQQTAATTTTTAQAAPTAVAAPIVPTTQPIS